MECTHSVRLKNICCICGVEVFDKQKEFCYLTTTDLIKTTYYKEKKLTLVIDLDETILNTTFYFTSCIDGSTLKLIYANSIKSIKINNQLIEFDMYFLFNTQIFFIKFRENAILFLKKCKKFKIYIFSMGTKEYVERIKEYLIMNGVDILGSISREENLSLTKSVSRLGLSERRVIIIDDRVDVWDYFDGVILIKPFIYYDRIKNNLLKRSDEKIIINTDQSDLVNKRIKLENKIIKKEGIYINKEIFDGEIKELENNSKEKNVNLEIPSNSPSFNLEIDSSGLLSLLPLLKKIRKKFKKVKNVKRILIKEKKNIFKDVEMFFNLNDDLLPLAYFFKIKFIKNIRNILMIDKCILLKVKNVIYNIRREWFLDCIYMRKMINYEGFIVNQNTFESSSEFNEGEYL